MWRAHTYAWDQHANTGPRTPSGLVLDIPAGAPARHCRLTAVKKQQRCSTTDLRAYNTKCCFAQDTGLRWLNKASSQALYLLSFALHELSAAAAAGGNGLTGVSVGAFIGILCYTCR